MKPVLIGVTLALSVGYTHLLAQTASGDFTYNHQLDDFTDEDRSTIYVIDEDGEAMLMWGCSANGLTALMSTGYMIGRNDRVNLMWRVDRNEPSQEIQAIQGENQSAMLPDNRIYPFTEEAMDGRTVIFQITDPFDGDAERYRYSLVGLTASLRLLPCYQPPDARDRNRLGPVRQPVGTPVGSGGSFFELTLPGGETYEFPSMAFFHESQDGGRKEICIIPLDQKPGLGLVASFDLEGVPTDLEQDAVMVFLGTLDPLFGLYGTDDGPNHLSLSSFADGVLSGSYTGTLWGIGPGGVTTAEVRASFAAPQVMDDTCS